MRTLTPLDSICWAMVFIFDAEPLAFWIWHFRLYLAQSALRAFGSAVIQRGEEVVSGRMMPTLAFLPSTVPPVVEDDDEPVLPVDFGAADELLLPLELPHAERANAAVTPTAAMTTLLLRICRQPFHEKWALVKLRP